jgi:biotin synthase
MEGLLTIRAIEQLYETGDLPDEQMAALIETDAFDEPLAAFAERRRRQHYGTDVYVRGLIEFTNYCRNDCYYCGIRKGNARADRYRLSEAEILDCCRQGYELGFRTFVLQGGEDPYFTEARMCSLVEKIRSLYPDCAITLSAGEWPRASYEAFYRAGANRYLLRHETADDDHYRQLHPAAMSPLHRKQCLRDLKEIGYQVGAGFMVGSPGQGTVQLLKDLRFLQDLSPDMIGVGPFIHHEDTPFGHCPDGSFKLTLRLLSILRLMFPYVLLPATTALGTIHPLGREMGLKAGANVVMPNLSPVNVREKYALYENKICTGEESAQCRGCLEQRVASAGYRIVTDRGDVKRDRS